MFCAAQSGQPCDCRTTSTADSIEIREVEPEPLYVVTIADLEVLRARAVRTFVWSSDEPTQAAAKARKRTLDAEIARRRALGET